ncbi:hypothetical protein ACFWPA_09880 [Rhodococcus sp. NPDC058505]|uniref:hypothetical protein n=1 Tax=unclassified Rhodococcus (in: high G+C Gram-positive bacteria) TaxID=192944 RepID=UPI00364EB9D9
MFSTNVRRSITAIAATGFLLSAGAGVAAAQLPSGIGGQGLPFPGDGNSFNAGVGGAAVGPIATPGIQAGPGGIGFGGGGTPAPATCKESPNRCDTPTDG